MSLLKNLSVRARLLRLALCRRFIYDEIVEMAVVYGTPINEVVANLGPVELLTRVTGHAVVLEPDFSLLRPADLIVEHGETVNWSSEPSVARFLAQLAVLKSATTIVELGCFIGWTTAHLALALRHLGRDGCVHYLDANSRHLATTTATLRRLGLETWGRPCHGLSLDPNTQAQLPQQADIVFIDTTHQFADTCAEIEFYATRLSPGGCLVLHDSVSAVGVRRAIARVRDQFDVFTFATERSNGLTVLLPRKI